MDAIDEFLERYVRERDYYAGAAAIARDLLEARLFAEGVRAIVSARAKNVNRLRDKLRKRAQSKPPATVDEVRASVVDLAGARVALYFPGDRRRVNALIVDVFKSVETKEFPQAREAATGVGACHRSLSSDELDRSWRARPDVSVEDTEVDDGGEDAPLPADASHAGSRSCGHPSGRVSRCTRRYSSSRCSFWSLP